VETTEGIVAETTADIVAETTADIVAEGLKVTIEDTIHHRVDTMTVTAKQGVIITIKENRINQIT